MLFSTISNFVTYETLKVRVYGTYAMDSLYLETALKHHAVLVSLDETDFLLRIKHRVGIEIYHPRDLII
jgi:hypothetical protein